MVLEAQTETGFMSTLSASSPGHLYSQMASLWTRGSSPILECWYDIESMTYRAAMKREDFRAKRSRDKIQVCHLLTR